MTPAYIHLGALQLLLAALLILINAAISFALRLGLERSLLVASVRTIVQLLLVGFVLNWVFALKAWPIVVLLGLFMVTLSGVTAVNRTKRRFRGIHQISIYATLVSSFLVTGVAVVVILGVHPWYEPQYLIPLLGMILGNTMNGVSLGMGRMMDGLTAHRDQVEALLALGASGWEAAQEVLRDAVRTGMTPIINSMMVVGLVSLPGMMTGQMLAGAAPADAVRYQIVIMFLIAAGAGLGTLGIVLLSFRSLFSRDHQLLVHRLRKVGK